ncbi:hypothetical protein DFP72DRAFT_588506 [Ephemerocybe angulata]|uniref:Uncharacterized protein n=1 Tax=Ephemerocybe angulata TaxID=980116 RepID=A0A8H6M105_9AGAR|nr:hypothetical protein DFP72DRAFT_588506 [Tulosesus angulatus]
MHSPALISQCYESSAERALRYVDRSTNLLPITPPPSVPPTAHLRSNEGVAMRCAPSRRSPRGCPIDRPAIHDSTPDSGFSDALGRLLRKTSPCRASVVLACAYGPIGAAPVRTRHLRSRPLVSSSRPWGIPYVSRHELRPFCVHFSPVNPPFCRSASRLVSYIDRLWIVVDPCAISTAMARSRRGGRNGGREKLPEDLSRRCAGRQRRVGGVGLDKKPYAGSRMSARREIVEGWKQRRRCQRRVNGFRDAVCGAEG